MSHQVYDIDLALTTAGLINHDMLCPKLVLPLFFLAPESCRTAPHSHDLDIASATRGCINHDIILHIVCSINAMTILDVLTCLCVEPHHRANHGSELSVVTTSPINSDFASYTDSAPSLVAIVSLSSFIKQRAMPYLVLHHVASSLCISMTWRSQAATPFYHRSAIYSSHR